MPKKKRTAIITEMLPTETFDLRAAELHHPEMVSLAKVLSDFKGRMTNETLINQLKTYDDYLEKIKRFLALRQMFYPGTVRRRSIQSLSDKNQADLNKANSQTYATYSPKAIELIRKKLTELGDLQKAASAQQNEIEKYALLMVVAERLGRLDQWLEVIQSRDKEMKSRMEEFNALLQVIDLPVGSTPGQQAEIKEKRIQYTSEIQDAIQSLQPTPKALDEAKKRIEELSLNIGGLTAQINKINASNERARLRKLKTDLSRAVATCRPLYHFLLINNWPNYGAWDLDSQSLLEKISKVNLENVQTTEEINSGLLVMQEVQVQLKVLIAKVTAVTNSGQFASLIANRPIIEAMLGEKLDKLAQFGRAGALLNAKRPQPKNKLAFVLGVIFSTSESEIKAQIADISERWGEKVADIRKNHLVFEFRDDGVVLGKEHYKNPEIGELAKRYQSLYSDLERHFTDHLPGKSGKPYEEYQSVSAQLNKKIKEENELKTETALENVALVGKAEKLTKAFATALQLNGELRNLVAESNNKTSEHGFRINLDEWNQILKIPNEDNLKSICSQNVKFIGKIEEAIQKALNQTTEKENSVATNEDKHSWVVAWLAWLKEGLLGLFKLHNKGGGENNQFFKPKENILASLVKTLETPLREIKTQFEIGGDSPKQR